MHSKSLHSHYFGSVGTVTFPNVPLEEVPLMPDAPTIGIREAPTPVPSFRQVVRDTQPKNETLKTQRDKLMAAIAEIEDEAEEFLQACHNERQEDLKQQHEKIRALGREQKTRIQTAYEASLAAEVDWNKTRERKAHAHDAIRQAEYRRANISRWASERQIGEAEHAIAVAKVEFKAALDTETEALRKYNESDNQLALERAKLKELEFKEARVRGELSGRPYQDEEFGLVAQP